MLSRRHTWAGCPILSVLRATVEDIGPVQGPVGRRNRLTLCWETAMLHLFCPDCQVERAFERPLCIDEHGGDCPELSCSVCGLAVFDGPLLIAISEARGHVDSPAAEQGASSRAQEGSSPSAQDGVSPSAQEGDTPHRGDHSRSLHAA